MKKILSLLFVLLLLCACTGNKPEEVEVVETPKTTETDFPFEDMLGYWVSMNDGEYLKIYKNDKGLYAFEEGDFNSFNTGEININSIEKLDDCMYYFEVSYPNMNGLIGDKNINIEELDFYYIYVEDEKYVYCGPDEYQAKLASTHTVIGKFMDELNGIWNSDDDNNFISFGTNEIGEYLIAPGLYDSEGDGAFVIDSFKKLDGEVYEVWTHHLVNEEVVSFNIDKTNIPSGKLKVNGINYHFGGYGFDEAYEEYAARFH